MKTLQIFIDDSASLPQLQNLSSDFKPQVLLALGTAEALEKLAGSEILKRFPGAKLFGGTSAGHIVGTEVCDAGVVLTALQFERTPHKFAYAACSNAERSFEAGKEIVNQLIDPTLRHIVVISEGLSINGSSLVEGMKSILPSTVSVTGGLCGDGANFRETKVIVDGALKTGFISALGLYGAHIHVGFGSQGGWDPFGPERVVTKSEHNVLFELDNEPALALYKRYLGPQAKDLPSSGLLFPLSMRTEDNQSLVRTILGIDETRQSITFAGDVPEGRFVRLMRANFDRLIEGASNAGSTSKEKLLGIKPEFAFLVSCVGRKLILQQRIEEEVEAVQERIGPEVAMTGFYSYGEISPYTPTGQCELHNQTMTITVLSERE